MRVTRVLSLVLVLAMSGSSELLAQRQLALPRIRSTDHIVSAAMSRGVARSETFRSLVQRLHGSDLVVHVVRRSGAAAPSGFTQFVTATPFGRDVRITITADDAGDLMVALLGHELQHAAELADAAWVRDEEAYGALYRTIGEPSCGSPRWCFDTALAVQRARQILKELRRRGLAPAVQASAAAAKAAHSAKR